MLHSDYYIGAIFLAAMPASCHNFANTVISTNYVCIPQRLHHSFDELSSTAFVASVYRKTASEISDILAKLGATCLLVDMQDAGTRLYTFVWTMYTALEVRCMLTPGYTQGVIHASNNGHNNEIN